MGKKLIYFLGLLVFCVSSTNFAMLTKVQQKTREHSARQQLHAQQLREIANMQDVKEVDHKIQSMHDDINQKIYDELGRSTNSHPKQWKEKFEENKKLLAYNLKHNNLHAQHDPAIPPYLRQEMIQALESAGINPHNVQLEYKDQKDNTLAWARGTLAIDTMKPTPLIRLYGLLENENIFSREFTFRHEICHLQHAHSLMQVYTRTNGSTKTHQLKSLLEQQADLCASQNSALACTGMLQECHGGHPAIIDNKAHCQEMKRMCALILKKEKLSEKLS